MASSKGTGAAALTKDNYVLPAGGYGVQTPEAVLEAEGTQDLADWFTGKLANPQLGPAITTAVVHKTKTGDADQSESQVFILPEGVSGTFTLGCNLSVGGLVDTTAALDLDASAATVQTALDAAGANLAANDVVVTKVPGRRIFGLIWGTNAAGRNVAVDASVVTVTLTPNTTGRVSVADIPTADGARTA